MRGPGSPWNGFLFLMAGLLGIPWCVGSAFAREGTRDGTGVAKSPVVVSSFAVDVSPPLNQPVGLGFIPAARTREHPLLAKGIVLRGSGKPVVLCAIDWMEFHNDAFSLLQARIAEAAETVPSRVSLHCLHQHTAPALDPNAQMLMLPVDSPRRIATAAYLKSVADRIALAVRSALPRSRRVTHVGTSQARIERMASSRRLLQKDGSIAARMSSTKDPKLRSLPEGRIDPWLKTVTLSAGEQAVVQLHYYATHPQSFYGDRRLTYDVPGIVRERLQKDTGVFQVYFTGCGGDVAFGKYNDGTAAARDRLVERLDRGMRQSVKAVKRYKVEGFAWKSVPVRFGRRREPTFSNAYCRQVLSNPMSSESQRLKAAITLAWNQRVDDGDSVLLYRLAIGPVQVVHLPGEPFVEYQLAAQEMAPKSFVAVAGFGDCGMSYIGGDRIFTDRGGYEQSWALAGPSEALLLKAIAGLLSRKPKSGDR